MIFAIQAKVNAQPPPLPMWTTANTFTYALSCVYFCDAEQAPLRGVVGGTTSISYTLDGGATWTASTITGFAAGNISCFTFKDSLHGWASILDNSPNYGLLMTTDGGLTWNLDSSADPQINGIFYNKTNHRLFVASETDSAEYSTDNGLSWKKFAGIGYTGFAFIGDKFGVMPTHDGTAANPHYYLYTADGGQTWKSSFMWFPGWQPVG
ncbi:MAG TPA: hypothetical protein VG537_07795, partial [Candidatus Kapabacteria bacterium]|nr:hypothetical protein [Candidatus Kapabacteria bacterium]